MQYILATIILVFTLREVKGGYEHWCTSSMAARGNCGHGLDDLLSLACGPTGYNARGSNKRKKRSATGTKMVYLNMFEFNMVVTPHSLFLLNMHR